MSTCLKIFLLLFVFSIQELQSEDPSSQNVRVKRDEPLVIKLPVVRHNVFVKNSEKKTKKIKNQLVIQTAEGKVRGYRREVNGYKCYSFYGIPYGSAPIRFLAPKPPKPWKGILDGTKSTPPCFQKDKRLGLLGGVEDCLYLEVHTMNVTGKRPVVFWVHGGSYNFGSTGQFEMMRLTNENLVVVSITYRLGVFGFLSSGTKDAPGNAGLKDVVMALRWVKRNIRNFGGDPDKVCLYGCSSGANIVDYIGLNPHAKGLFSSVFSQSGSALASWSINKESTLNTLQLARMFGVTSLDWEIIIDKLRNVSANELLHASENLFVEPLPITLFTPTVETAIPGEESAILEVPYHSLKSGNYIDVPFMMSFTDKEGLAIFDEHLDLEALYNVLETNIEWLFPVQYIPNWLSQKNTLNIYNSLKDYYFHGKQPSVKTLPEIIEYLGDFLFYNFMHLELELRNQTAKSPLYVFEFAYDSEYNSFHKAVVNVSGVGHAEDLGFYLDLPAASINSKTSPTTKLVAARVLKMLANFAEYHNPTPMKTKLLPVKFLPYRKTANGTYYKVTDKLETYTGNPHIDRYNFAKEMLFKLHVDNPLEQSTLK